MNFAQLMPLASCIACSMLAVAVLARDSRRRTSRLAVLLSLCGAWWAACEVLWNGSEDPAAAVRLVRLSALGWMFIGPAVLHLFLELTSHPFRRRALCVPLLYGPAVVFAGIDVTTDWIHPAAIRTSWGFGYEVSPLFAVPWALSSGLVALGIFVGIRRLPHWGPPAHRRLILWMFAGLAPPLVIATFTDGLAPLLGWQLPRFGAASISLMVASVAWCFLRYGYSLLAPGAFAAEILATLREGVALVRPDGLVHTVNAGMARLAGVAPQAFEGRPVASWIDAPLPEPDAPERECLLTRPGGDPVPVSVRSSLLCDKQGHPIGRILVVRDLREIASLRSRLITSGRLASVGQLAAGIAHEINNPVAYVRSNLGSLAALLEGLDKSSDPEAELREGQELIHECLDGVDRVAAIVRDVKTFSHSGGSGDELIEVDRMLETVLRVAAPQLRYGAPVVRDFQPVPPIRGSTQQLEQVFLNLVINASQAIQDQSPIRLVVRSSTEGDRVLVEVHDEGCGIPTDQLDRIFDPFFTTKPVGEGTGLGLSISYQIVKAHGGEVVVDSVPGRGTCFRVELPSAERAAPC